MARLPPGCHQYLPRSDINTAMRNYLSVDGWYLLRPSLSNPGQYSICVSYGGEVKNFKINCDQNGKYSVSSKKFDSLDQLLDAYSKNPFRSRKGGTEIYLKYPIPVDRELEQRHIQLHNAELSNQANQGVHMQQQHQQPVSPGPQLPPRNAGSLHGSRGAPPPLPDSSRPSARGMPSSPGAALSNRPSIATPSMQSSGHAPPLPSRNNVGPAPPSGRRPLPSTPGLRVEEQQPAVPVRRNNSQSDSPPPPLPARVGSSESRRTGPVTTGPGGRALAAPVSELPPGWEEFFSEEHGRPYYYHDATKKTVWQRPGGAPSPGPSRARPLPTVPPTQEALPAVPNRNGFGAGQDAPPLPNRMSSDLGSRLPARQQASLPVQPEPPARGRSASSTPAINANDIPPPVSRRQTAPIAQRMSLPAEDIPPPVPTSNRSRRPAPAPAEQSRLPPVPPSNRGPPPAVPISGRSALPPVPTQDAPPAPNRSEAPPLPVSHQAPPIPSSTGRSSPAADLPPVPASSRHQAGPSLPPELPGPAAAAPASNLPPQPAVVETSVPTPPPMPVSSGPPAPPGPPPPPAPPAPAANAPAPPGPPPPPDGGAPSLSGIGASLAAGRAALKKAEPAAAAPPSDARGDLLSSIRTGITLKKIDPESEKPKAPVPDGPGGLMNSLMSAFDSRRQAIGEESDDEAEEVMDDDDW